MTMPPPLAVARPSARRPRALSKGLWVGRQGGSVGWEAGVKRCSRAAVAAAAAAEALAPRSLRAQRQR